MKFTHLHVHSHYSLLDGLPKIDELVDYVKKLGMEAVALTDHGNIYGAVEFYQKAKKAGIKPIIGTELYLAPNRMTDKRPKIDDKSYHILILVKNETGYKNLVKLITKANLEGFYYKPRIDEELLFKHSEGLIVSTACVQGKIPRLIISGRIEEAKKTALKYKEVFGKDNFYLELQYHPAIPEQDIVNKHFVDSIFFTKFMELPDSILDIGSGPGFFLLEGKRRGWKTLGIDPSKQAVEHARNMGVEIIEGLFSPSLVDKLDKFDVVHMNNVLEHIP